MCHRDLEKVFCDATKAPDEKYLIGRLQVDHYLESFGNANRIADYIYSYQLSLAKLRERAIEFDLKDSTNVYSTFDIHSSAVCGHVYDLLDHDHEDLDLDTVLKWQHWYHVWAHEVDIVSSKWMTKLLFNSLKPDLHEEVYQEFMELPIDQRGSASALWITMDKICISSFETTQTLQNFIHTFRLSSYPGENVHAACLQFKAIFKALRDADDIPPQSATTMLKGFATSSDPDFNTLCDNLALQEQLTSTKLCQYWTTNDSDLLYDHLKNNILHILEIYYQSHDMAGTWAMGKE